jgi:anti-anti-sigma factor
MEYTLQAADNSTELILEGNVTIEDAQTLHSALLEPQAIVSELVVNMKDVREIDLTCLQLLCSAHHAATKEGRKVKLVNVGAETRDSIERLGFARHIGCREDSTGSCLWMMRGNA